jgi:hypothetical protein
MQNVLAAVPAYCSNGGLHTPAQIAACLKAGWSQPTTGAANAGYYAGHNVAPYALIIGIIIGVILLASRSRSGSPAASRS